MAALPFPASGGVLAILVLSGAALSAQAIRNVPRITIDELKSLMDRKAVLVIDVTEIKRWQATD